MNMIDYNKAVDALEKERQYLLNREQYGAENVLVKHAINVIHKLPVIRQPEVVHCKDCINCVKEPNGELYCDILAVGYEPFGSKKVTRDWFCADGAKVTL